MVRMIISLAKLRFSKEKRIRQNYPEEHIKKLLDSMNKIGQIYEILIDENWEVRVGGNRYLAAKLGNWDTIKVDKRDGLSEDEWFLLELHENIRRKELDPVEEAIGLAKAKDIYERLYPDTKQYIIGGKTRGKEELKPANDKLSVANEEKDVTKAVPLNSFVKSEARRRRVSERTIHRKLELGQAILDKKIDHATIDKLRNKQISTVKVMKKLKSKPLESAKLQLQIPFCKDCKKGTPLTCPNCKETIIWCQRYKNPFLRKEHDKICEGFEEK